MMLALFVASLAAAQAQASSNDVPAKYQAAWDACRNEKLDFSREGVGAELKGCSDLIAATDLNDNEIKAIAHTNRGMLNGQANRFDVAKSEFDEAIKLNPKLAPALYNRALLFSTMGDTKAAVADYTAAISALPKMVEAYINRGIIFAQSGQLDLALADFSKAIELEPGSADNYENRAHLLRDMGRTADADADEAKARQLMKK